MNKHEKHLAKWEKIKNKGFMSYIIKMGVFYYGLIFFLFWMFLFPLINNSFEFNSIFKEAFKNTFKSKLIINGILSSFAGIFMANATWKSFKKKYE